MKSNYVTQNKPWYQHGIVRPFFIFLAAAVVLFSQGTALAITSASVTLSDPRPTQTATYDFKASSVTTTAIKCIRVEFDMSADGSGGKPTDMNITSLAFSGTSDYIPTPASWAPTNNNTTGVSTIVFGTGETPADAADRNIVLTSITNGSVVNNDYFMIVNTYNNVDCATSPVDNSVVGFLFTDGQAVTLSVDGSLSFSVAGVTGNGSLAVNSATITNGLATTSTTVPFGTVTSSANKIAAQDVTVSTNSGNGYTLFTRYTAAPTSGSNTISDSSGTNGTPVTFSGAGTEGFGYTTEDATLSTGPGATDRFTSAGGNKWSAFTTSNAELIYSAAAVSSQTTRIGYQVGVATTTEPGSYVTSVILTAVPVY